MPVNKRYIFLISAILSCSQVFSQYDLNSPYSRYGIGDIDRTGWGVNRALGGIGIGTRQQDQINYLNPASYTSQDTMSFIWDVGLFGKSLQSTVAGSGISSRNSMNFDHVGMSIPVTKHYFMSLGIMPYSTMGYKLTDKQVGMNIGEADNSYYGYGNINQIYFGHALAFWKKRINIGVNMNYYFGSLHKENSMSFVTKADASSPSLLNQQTLVPKGIGFNVGAQFVTHLPMNSKLIIGVTYDLETKLKTEYKNYFIREYNTAYKDTITLYNQTANYNIPQKIGLGISYLFHDKLLIGIDYTRQNWKNNNFVGVIDSSFKTSNRIGFGIQYTPDEFSYSSYFRKIRYRIGGYYDDSNLSLNGTAIKDMGLSAGFGMPFKNTHTMFNFAFEVGQRGTLANNLIKMNYTRFTFSVSFYDFWFVKRKYD